MKQGGLVLILLLSLGINVGLIAGKLLWGQQPSEPPEASGPEQEADFEPADEPGDEPPVPREEASSLETPEVERPPVPHSMPPRLARGLERMAGELGLQGENRRLFLEIQDRFFEQTLVATAHRRRAERDLRRELLSEAPQRQRADRLLGEVTAAQRQLEQAFLDNYFATRDLLGPDQARLFRRWMRRVRHLRDELQRQQQRAPSRFRQRPPETDPRRDLQQPR